MICTIPLPAGLDTVRFYCNMLVDHHSTVFIPNLVLIRGRALAVGERLWSNQNVKDPNEATKRIWEHRCRYLRFVYSTFSHSVLFICCLLILAMYGYM